MPYQPYPASRTLAPASGKSFTATSGSKADRQVESGLGYARLLSPGTRDCVEPVQRKAGQLADRQRRRRAARISASATLSASSSGLGGLGGGVAKAAAHDLDGDAAVETGSEHCSNPAKPAKPGCATCPACSGQQGGHDGGVHGAVLTGAPAPATATGAGAGHPGPGRSSWRSRSCGPGRTSRRSRAPPPGRAGAGLGRGGPLPAGRLDPPGGKARRLPRGATRAHHVGRAAVTAHCREVRGGEREAAGPITSDVPRSRPIVEKSEEGNGKPPGPITSDVPRSRPIVEKSVSAGQMIREPSPASGSLTAV